MPKHHTKTKLKSSRKEPLAGKLERATLSCWSVLKHFLPELPKHRWARRLTLGLIGLIILLGLGMYGIGRWYIHSESHLPTTLGVSFVPDYATYLGVDPQKAMDALINQVHVKQFRLTSYWDDIETTPGQYNFTQLDWEFAKADAAHATVNLTLGLRQPRYPECHAPSFIDTGQPEDMWYPQLKAFMAAVVNRYKNNPALQNYQLENEYFLKGFGDCDNFDRSRLIDEYHLVQSLDPKHDIIVGRSNNDLGTPIGQPTPNIFSVSIYQRVWDANLTHRYLEYPFPAWYYAFLAGWQKITTGKDMIIGELQAESWAPDGKNLPDISVAEQNKSFNAQRLKATVQFGKATGMKTIDLWGAEYWYYRQQVLHDPSLMTAAAQEITSCY